MNGADLVDVGSGAGENTPRCQKNNNSVIEILLSEDFPGAAELRGLWS